MACAWPSNSPLYTGVQTLAQANALIEATNQPNAGTLLGALHFFRSGGHPEQVTELAPGRIHIVRWCDAPLAAPALASPGARRWLRIPDAMGPRGDWYAGKRSNGGAGAFMASGAHGMACPVQAAYFVSIVVKHLHHRAAYRMPRWPLA